MVSPTRDGRVVLLHGQPGVGAAWRRVVGMLDGTLDVLAPDRPGYGRNARPAGGIIGNVEWLTELLDEHGDGLPTVVVAHSWAGGPALELAYRHPAAVSGLVLVGSVGPDALTRVDHVLATPGFTRTVTRIASYARRHPSRWNTFVVEQQALFTELAEVLDHLESVATPAVVIAGRRDRVTPFAASEALAARLPQAELVAVPKGGHALHRTHPEVVAHAIRRMLGDVARP